MVFIPHFVAQFGTDTAAKRIGAFNWCSSSDDIMPIPDGGGADSEAQRGHFWGMYPPLTAPPPAPVSEGGRYHPFIYKNPGQMGVRG